MVFAAAVSTKGSSCQRCPPLPEPWHQPDVQLLFQRRRLTTDACERTRLSKQIRKVLRHYQRQKQNNKVTAILTEFQDLGTLHLQIHDPERRIKQVGAHVPCGEDFSGCLRQIFASESCSSTEPTFY